MVTSNPPTLPIDASTAGSPSDRTPSTSSSSDTSLPAGYYTFPTPSATSNARERGDMEEDESSGSGSPPEKRRKLDKGKGKAPEYNRGLGAMDGLVLEAMREKEALQRAEAEALAKEKAKPKPRLHKPKPQRRQVMRAKEAKWKDIPNWAPRTDCPLFRLPAEILDLCFGTKLDHGLQFRDYLALAGVSKYFRLHMTNSVWREIHGAVRPNVFWDERTTNQGTRLFTQPVENWQVLPLPRHRTYVDEDEYYDESRPPREEWTEAEYNFYTLEDDLDYEREREARRVAAVRMERAAAYTRERIASKKASLKIKVDELQRTVLAVVKGLPNGGTPEPKDENGLPPGALRLEDLKPPKGKRKKAQGGDGGDAEEAAGADEVKPATGDPSADDPASASRGSADPDKPPGLFEDIPPSDRWVAAKKLGEELCDLQRLAFRSAGDAKDPEWVVPPPETKDDDPEPPEVRWNSETGEQLPHDYYPSNWRAQAARFVRDQYINKTDAIKVFKVGEAELLCLKHYLVPNPMNPKTPQCMYMLAAVQALALRSHGGPIGHHYHVIFANEKAEKAMSTRRVKKPAPPEAVVDNSATSPGAGSSATSAAAEPAAPAPAAAPAAAPAPATAPGPPATLAAAAAAPPPTLAAAAAASIPTPSADPAADPVSALTLNERKKLSTAASKADDLGAKYGVDKDSGLWYWRGVFDDFVAEHRRARPKPKVSGGEGAEADGAAS
ncbi:hypothetical protein IAT38_007360 [Cryptococcus sp. DSM 104549]